MELVLVFLEEGGHVLGLPGKAKVTSLVETVRCDLEALFLGFLLGEGSVASRTEEGRVGLVCEGRDIAGLEGTERTTPLDLEVEGGGNGLKGLIWSWSGRSGFSVDDLADLGEEGL